MGDRSSQGESSMKWFKKDKEVSLKKDLSDPKIFHECLFGKEEVVYQYGKDIILKSVEILDNVSKEHQGNIFSATIEYYLRVCDELQKIPPSILRNELFFPLFGLPLLEMQVDTVKELAKDYPSKDQATFLLDMLRTRFEFMYRISR